MGRALTESYARTKAVYQEIAPVSPIVSANSLMFSATMTPETRALCKKFMQDLTESVVHAHIEIVVMLFIGL